MNFVTEQGVFGKISAMMFLAGSFRLSSAAQVPLDAVLPLYDGDSCPQQKRNSSREMAALNSQQRCAMAEDVIALIQQTRNASASLVHIKALEILHDLSYFPDVQKLLLSNPVHMMTIIDDADQRNEIHNLPKNILSNALSCAWNVMDEDSTLIKDVKTIVSLSKAILCVDGATRLVALFERVPSMLADLTRSLIEDVDERFAREALSLLRLLTVSPQMTLRMFETPKLVDVLLGCSQSSAFPLEMRENAFACLFKITSNPANSERMFARTGVVDTLLQCMDTCEDEMIPLNISEWAVVILLVIFNSSERHQESLFRQVRAIESLLRVIKAPRTKNARLREWAVGGLMVLMAATPNRRDAIKLSGHLVEVLQTGESESLKEHALLGLTALSLDVDNLNELRADHKLLYLLMDICLDKDDKPEWENNTSKVKPRALDLMTKLSISLEKAETIRVMLVLCSAFNVPRLSGKSQLRTMDRYFVRLIGNALIPTT